METTSAIRQVHTNTRPFTRCRKRSEQSPKERSGGFGRNGFLKHQFQPLHGFYVRNWEKAEKEFLLSMSNFCNYYGLKEPDVSGLFFPTNIHTAYQQLSEVFKKDGLNLKIMQDTHHDACLATTKTFDVGYRLFYIPIKPICRLGMHEDGMPLSKLVSAIYQYLYQTVNITYYREPGYLNYLYETIENWIDEDNDSENEDYRKCQRSELNDMKTLGDSYLRILKRPFKLELLQSIFSSYRKSKSWNHEVDMFTQEIIKLITDYPERSIKQSIPYNFYQTGENDLICLEHYLSFYWSGKDGFTEMIDEMVNNELQEMGYQEEPVALQWFDKIPKVEQHDFDFETRLFALIDNLIDLVNEYDHENGEAL